MSSLGGRKPGAAATITDNNDTNHAFAKQP